MKYDEIKIPQCFLDSNPSKDKYDRVFRYFSKYGELDEPIVVSDDGTLCDGYIRYLVIKNKFPYYDIPIKINKTYRTKNTTYVYGKHPNSNIDKEYVWRMPAKASYIPSIGESLLVQTKCGIAPIVVTRVFTTDQCPIDGVVKKVIKWGGIEKTWGKN